MIKNRITALILFLCMLMSLAACKPKTPSEPVITEEYEQTFTLKNADSTLIAAVDAGIPYLAWLGTHQNYQNALREKSPMFLPLSYRIGEKYIEFDWQFTGADAETDSLQFNFTDKTAQLTYRIILSVVPGLAGPFSIRGEFFNNTDMDITYSNTEMFCTDLIFDAVPTAWSFKKESGVAEGWEIYSGAYFEGTGIYKTPLAEGGRVTISTNTVNDWNGSGYIPMIYLDNNGTNGVYLGVEWPDCKIEASAPESGAVRLSANISEHFTFKTNVPAGSLLNIPEVYLGVYDGDVDDASNIFKRWFFNVKSPDVLRENELEPLTQMDMQRGLEVYDWGIQSIKWDYGWWSDVLIKPDEIWRTLEGSWEVRNSGYLGVLAGYGCQTLREFTDLAHERGLSVAIYLLLHDAQEDVEVGLTSVGPNGHNEWFSNRTITVGRSADLGNVECVEYLKTALEEFFTSTGVDTWRSDFEPICYQSDRENRHAAHGSDVSYWCAVGFYDLLDYLIENVEGFRYECCGSGGSLKDFATLRRAVVINNDDSADYTSLRMSFYDSSYCIPSAQLQLPCNIDTFKAGSAQYNGTADADFGMRSIMLGAVMMGSWSNSIDGEMYYNYCTLYNENIKPLVRDADLYHILPRPDGVNWDGIQYADADSKNEIKGCVFLFKPTDAEGDSKHIVLRGLDPGTTYTLEFLDRPSQNVTLTGEKLMSDGITVTITEDMGSEIIWIKS